MCVKGELYALLAFSGDFWLTIDIYADMCILAKCESATVCSYPLGKKLYYPTARFASLSVNGNFKPNHTQFPIAATSGGQLLHARAFTAPPDGGVFATTDAFEPSPLVTAGIYATNWTQATVAGQQAQR